MSDYVQMLYPVALDCGMAVERFWDYSIGEIRDYLESHGRREQQKVKQRLAEKHFLAKDIAQHVDRLLNGTRNREELLELWDFFPSLFEEERQEAGERMREQQAAVYKAQMRDFAYRHNHRNGGEDPWTE